MTPSYSRVMAKSTTIAARKEVAVVVVIVESLLVCQTKDAVTETQGQFGNQDE
jgi:hypothetical protein